MAEQSDLASPIDVAELETTLDRGSDSTAAANEEVEVMEDPVTRGMTAVVKLMVGVFLGAAVLHKQEGWDFEYACFFSLTVVTTVGYGGNYPATAGGKAFVVAFASFAIPVASFALNDIAHAVIAAMQTLFSMRRRRTAQDHQSGGELAGTARHVMQLQCACLSWAMHLCVCGGLAFSVIEGWAFGDAFYFSFVSLTTIGVYFIPGCTAY
jgi:hypothetical protein